MFSPPTTPCIASVSVLDRSKSAGLKDDHGFVTFPAVSGTKIKLSAFPVIGPSASAASKTEIAVVASFLDICIAKLISIELANFLHLEMFPP